MLAHIRQDFAIRYLPLWFPICALVSRTAMMAVQGSWVVWPWVHWLPLAFYLGYTHGLRRASTLDLALPFPARRLWLAHVLALGLGATAILALDIGLDVLVGHLGGVPVAAARLVDGGLRLGAGLVIAVALLQRRQPALARLTPGPVYSLYLAAVLVGVAPMVLLLDALWVIALLVLALGLGLHTWRSLPPALTLEPVADPGPMVETPGSGHPGSGAGEQRTHRGWSHRRPPAGGRRHSAFPVAADSFYLAFFFFLGIPLSGPDFFAWLLPVLGSWMIWVQLRLSNLAMLDPLPVSRRVFFAAMTRRPLAAVILGFACGAVFRGSLDGTSAIVVLLLAGLWLGLVALSLAALYALTCRVLWALLPPTLAASLLFNHAVERDWIALTALSDTADALVRRPAAALPGGEAVLVLLAVLVVGGAYALAEARFRRFEVPPSRGDAEPVETIWDLLSDKEGNLP